MRLALIVCCAVFPATAAAEPLGIAVGKGGYVVDRVALDVTPASDGAHVAMTVALRATNAATRLVEVPLDVPRGARLVALTVTHGDGRVAVAAATSADDARTRWSEHVQRGDRDPIALAFEETRNGMDRHDLRISSFVARQAATFELSFDVPFTGAQSLELDPRNQMVGRYEVRVGGRAVRAQHAWQRVDLVDIATAPAAPALPAASARRTLFGSAAPLVPRITISPPQVISCSFGGTNVIRRIVRRHQAQLAQCYNAVAQWRPGFEGDVVAHFRIEPDGHVSQATFTGTLTDARITSCLEGVFSTMQFPTDTAAAEVNYPLKFRMP